MRALSITLLGLLVLAWTFAGCGKQTLDTSSDTALKASVEKMRSSLADTMKVKFDEAIQRMTFGSMGMGTMMAGTATVPSAAQAKMRQMMHGKTVDEVLSQCNLMMSDELKELELRQCSAADAQVELTKFQVIKARFNRQKIAGHGFQPNVDMTVKNGTDKVISRVHFRCVLMVPGNTTPWVAENFPYEPTGGMKPGETVMCRVSPNKSGAWGSNDVPANATLTVEVVKLEGTAITHAAYSSAEFSQEDTKQLETLKKKLGI